RSLLAGGGAVGPAGLGPAPRPTGLLRGAGRPAAGCCARPHAGRPAQRRVGLLGAAGGPPSRHRAAQCPGPDVVGAPPRRLLPERGGDRPPQPATAPACSAGRLPPAAAPASPLPRLAQRRPSAG